MANSSAKKQLKSNTQRLNALKVAILTANVLYAAVHVLFRGPLTTFHKVSWLFLSLSYALPFYFIWIAAKPTYSDTGALIDGGSDVTASGVLEYAHDLIFLTVFVQVGLLFSRWTLLFYLVAPAYATYCMCIHMMASSPEEEDVQDNYTNISRKERRKADREARRQR